MTLLKQGDWVAVGDGAPTALVVDATWDPLSTNVDLVLFVCTSAGKALSPKHFVFFNNKTSPHGAVFLLEDNGVGGINHGAQVMLDMTALPPEAERLDILLVALRQGQTLAPVNDIRLDVWDPANGQTLTSFVLGEAGLCNCLNLARLCKDRGQWELWALGEPYPKDLASRIREYGIVVDN